MYPNAKVTEQMAVLGTINPASLSTGATSTGWVLASGFHRFLALIETGVLGSSATLDAKLEQATDSSGTGAKDVTSKAITQIVKASGDNKRALINLNPQELDVSGGFDYFRLTLTVGTAASIAGAHVFGMAPKNASAAGSNIAAVVEVVA